MSKTQNKNPSPKAVKETMAMWGYFVTASKYMGIAIAAVLILMGLTLV